MERAIESEMRGSGGSLAGEEGTVPLAGGATQSEGGRGLGGRTLGDTTRSATGQEVVSLGVMDSVAGGVIVSAMDRRTSVLGVKVESASTGAVKSVGGG